MNALYLIRYTNGFITFPENSLYSTKASRSIQKETEIFLETGGETKFATCKS